MCAFVEVREQILEVPVGTLPSGKSHQPRAYLLLMSN